MASGEALSLLASTTTADCHVRVQRASVIDTPRKHSRGLGDASTVDRFHSQPELCGGSTRPDDNVHSGPHVRGQEILRRRDRAGTASGAPCRGQSSTRQTGLIAGGSRRRDTCERGALRSLLADAGERSLRIGDQTSRRGIRACNARRRVAKKAPESFIPSGASTSVRSNASKSWLAFAATRLPSAA